MTSPPIDELHAWLALLGTPGVGRRRAADLLTHFGGAVEVMQAGVQGWQACLDPTRCAALSHALERSRPEWARSMSWLQADPRHHILTLGDPGYPTPLLHSPDPPLMLFAVGHIGLWRSPMVAIVGSRHSTPQGVLTARELARGISTAGVPVVSGLALGIDAAAHEGALQGTAGTIGVLGCGIDQVYPRRHHDLADRIIDKGLLVSEYPLGVPAIKENFPQRNRIIAGLAHATVVVEAAIRSGSLITARMAAEAGREVLAVPGPISSPQSKGCHWLIQQGAGLVESPRDIWEAAPSAFRDQLQTSERLEQAVRRGGRRRSSVQGGQLPSDGEGSLRSDGQTDTSDSLDLRRRLQGGPASIDDLVEGTKIHADRWQEALLLAEIEGSVGRLPGGRYQWLGSGT